MCKFILYDSEFNKNYFLKKMSKCKSTFLKYYILLVTNIIHTFLPRKERKGTKNKGTKLQYRIVQVLCIHFPLNKSLLLWFLGAPRKRYLEAILTAAEIPNSTVKDSSHRSDLATRGTRFTARCDGHRHGYKYVRSTVAVYQ